MRKSSYLSALLLLFFAYLVRLAQSATKTAANCGNLGTYDPSLKKCACAPGYTGSTCTQLKFAAMNNTISNYQAGLINSNNTSWGASFFYRTTNYEIMMAETFPNKCGVKYWTTDSTCAFWARRINSNEPWRVVGYLGNFFANDPLRVPFCHEARATIEVKDENQKHKYALVIYTTPKYTLKTGTYAAANFGKRTNCNPCDKLTPFPTAKENRPIYIAYKELNATTEAETKQEIEDLVFARQFVRNINNSPQNGYVNTEFTWLGLKTLTDKLPAYSVNPTPLIDMRTNLGTLYAERNGTKYRVLMYRFNTEGRKTQEHLGLLYSPGNKFPWENGQKFTLGPQLINGNRQEDAWLATDGQVITATIHDLDLCGSKLTQSCGAILTFNLRDSRFNLLRNSQGWSVAKQAYRGNIPGLTNTLLYRQRPYLEYCRDSKNQTYPCGLWTGSAWPDKAGNCNPNGASRSYRVAINP